jgi:acetate kinase
MNYILTLAARGSGRDRDVGVSFESEGNSPARGWIVAHLGNGASLCAVQDGRSVACTMGFTAVEGLMMGTRCGALDPGVLLYLMEERGFDAKGIEDLLYRKSGLLWRLGHLVRHARAPAVRRP